MMFGWFQRLLPRTGDFFGLFEAHAATLVDAANALSRLSEDDSSTKEQLRIINEREHDADDIIREVLTTVRRTFLTPFDRGAITSLIASMDDAIDEMQTAARAIDLYELHQLQDEMKAMVAVAVESAALTAEVMPLLRDIGRNGGRIHELTERLVRLEGIADEIHADGLKKAFKQFGETSTIQFIVAREIFKHLERVVDAFEDVANEIDGIVIDHA
jgi:predicted phosphate transport protein (TIGR00153 family)